MLGDKDVIAVVAVKDMEKAKSFYEGKLGLVQDGTDPDGTIYKSGNTQILVYQSQYAGTNQATSAAWRTGDLASIVEDLKSKGVVFEHYDFPNVKHEGDIHVLGDTKAVWFKDPDGNILAIDEIK